MEIIKFDKSSDKDIEVESKAFTPQTKNKHIDIWIYITSIDTLLAFINEIKNELNRRISY